MRAAYNLIAGQSLERLAALSDGVFAVAMTLLVLDLRAPVSSLIHSERELWQALLALAPRLLPYFMTFMTLGIFWVGQQTQFNRFVRSDRDLTWIQIGFLLVVTLMPFSTSLLAEFITYRVALLVYWFNILLLGVFIFVSWRYATRAGLLKEDTTPDLHEAMERRVLVAQALYAIGAALCFINTYVSIGFIVLVQLNYVFAPRIRALYRI
ncbi:MAG TPA: TMEM175 family protein [Candidatus Eremiobacteraceae bacterium]|nr:TMEM175 family protein [Candidatus Eremiobacteraceae bacterium]